MKRKLTFLTAAFALLAFLAIPMGMKGQSRAEVVTYTLDGTQTGGSSGYDTESDITQNNISWKVKGNTTMNPWRIGGKNISNTDRPVYSTTAITDNISKIEVTHGTASNITVNSWTVIVASDANFNNVVSTLTPTFAAETTTTINRPSGADWSNCYYKFVYNVSVSGGSNRFVQFIQADFYKQEGSGPVIATPTFSPAGGEYITAQNVTISCETQGATIYYTTNGSDPDNTSTQFTSAIPVSSTTTIKAIAYVGTDASSVATATYSIVQPLTTMQAIFDKATEVGTTATSVFITLGNWVVSGVSSNGKNVFVTDGTKGFVIFDGGGSMGFTAGDILSGTVSCKVQLYNGFAELTQLNSSTSGISVATGGSVTAANIAMANLAGVNTGALVHYENLTCSVDGNKYYLSDGTTTIQVFTSIYAFGSVFVANHVYNITGVYQQYNTSNGETKEVLPRSASDIEESGTDPTITITDATITVPAEGENGSVMVAYANFADALDLVELEIHTYEADGTTETTYDWITLSLDSDYNVEYNVDANNGAARTAYFKVESMSEGIPSNLVTINQAAYQTPHFTWDLSIASYNEVTDPDLVTWSSNYATMTNATGTSSTSASNYLGGDSNNRTSSRFYKNNVWTLTPATGYAITSVVLTATSENYANAFAGSTWTNATASVSGTTVTVTPTNGAEAIQAIVGGTCGFTSVAVYYVTDNTPSITANNVEIQYDATNGTITYTINNPVTGGTVTAATTASWLTLGSASTSPISFTCTANEGATERTATVTLTYTYNTNQTATKDVTVTQNANPNWVNSISDITSAGDFTVQGTIVAKSSRGFIVGDGTGYVYYYNQNYSQEDFNIGDMVKLAGSVVAYGGVFEFNNSTTITAATSSNYATEDPTILSGADMDARVGSSDSQLSSFVQYEGTLSVNNGHYNITDISGASTAIGSISYPLDTQTITALDGKQVKVTGYYVGVSSSTYYNTMIGTLEEIASTEPSITINPATLDVDAEQHLTNYLDLTYENIEVANTQSFTVHYYNAAGEEIQLAQGEAWMVAGVVKPESVYQVLCTIMANEGNARTAYFKVSAKDANNNDVFSNLVTVNQAAAVVPTNSKYVKVTAATDLTDGQYLIVYETDNIAFNGGLETLDATGNTIEVTISNNEITATNVTTAAEFTINTTAGTIKSASGYYIGQTSDANGLLASSETAYTNTISFNEGDADIVSSGGAYLRYNSASNQARFRYYKSASYTGQKAIQLYKKVDSSTATYTLDVAGYEEGSNGNWFLIASPVTVDPATVEGMILTGDDAANYDLYSFDESEENEWRNYKQHPFILEPGKGYLYAQKATTQGQVFHFNLTGTPYDGAPIKLSKHDGGDFPGWNLIGNPFGETAYLSDGRGFYIMKQDGTEIIAGTGDGSVAAMQGIFVIANQDEEEVTFTTTAPNAKDRFIINVSNNRGNVIDRAIVRFGEGQYLPKFQLNENSTKICIEENSNEYAVVYGANEGSMPVIFKAEENGTYTIDFKAENTEFSYLHLVDNMTGADVNLLENPSYSFDALTTDYCSRFKIIYAKTTTGVSEDFAFVSNGDILVNAQGTLQVVDMAGRIVATYKDVNSISTKDMTPGVYVLQLIGNEVRTQKIVVK